MVMLMEDGMLVELEVYMNVLIVNDRCLLLIDLVEANKNI